MTRWRLCQLTQQPLTEGPVVACGLGRLYIKEAVIEALLDRTSATSASAADVSIISHVKSIKDVKDALLTRNPDFDKGKHEVHTDYLDTHMTEFICPIVGIEMNGTHKCVSLSRCAQAKSSCRFCILWSCGHVLSEKALQAVDASARECLVVRLHYYTPQNGTLCSATSHSSSTMSSSCTAATRQNWPNTSSAWGHDGIRRKRRKNARRRRRKRKTNHPVRYFYDALFLKFLRCSAGRATVDGSAEDKH